MASAPVAIVGVGETPPVRRSPKDVRALTVDAVVAALEDAHCVVYDPCILAFFGSPQAGLTAVPGQPQNAIFSRA